MVNLVLYEFTKPLLSLTIAAMITYSNSRLLNSEGCLIPLMNVNKIETCAGIVLDLGYVNLVDY